MACNPPLILSAISGGYRIVELPSSGVLCAATSGGHFGSITVSGNLDVSGDTVLSGSLGVSGDTTLSAQLGVSGNAYVSGNLEVSTNLNVSGNLEVSTVNVSGDTKVSGTIYTDRLDVSCDAMVSGNLAVSTNLTVSGDTRVSGTTYTDRLDVSCDAMVSGNLGVSTNLTVSGDSSVSGNSFITGNTHIVGTAAIGATGPVADAILDVNSTTKTFVPPRMTTTQRNAISAPATGSVIYNTSTNRLNLYNGSSWLVWAVVTGATETVAFYDALGGTQTVELTDGLVTSWTSS